MSRHVRAVIRRLIVAHAAPHHCTTHRRYVAQAEELLVQAEDDPEFFLKVDEGEQLHIVVSRAMYVIENLANEASVLKKEFAEMQVLIKSTSAREEVSGIVSRYLPLFSLDLQKGDEKAALAGRLDFDALRERFAKKTHRQQLCLEILLAMLGGILATARSKGFVGHEKLFSILLQQGKSGHWAKRKYALDALCHVVRSDVAAREHRSKVKELTAAILKRHESHPWLQETAARLMGEVDKEYTESYLKRRLFEKRDTEIDLVAKERLIAVYLQLASPSTFHKTLLTLLDSKQPIAIAARVVRCVGVLPAESGAAMVESILERATPNDVAVFVAALEVVVSWSRDEASERMFGLLFKVTGACREPAVLEAAADFAVELALAGTDREHLIKWLSSFANQAVHESARAIAKITQLSDKSFQNFCDLLAQVPVGGRKTFHLEKIAPALKGAVNDASWLARSIAVVAADDWGVGVRVTAKKMIVWRGDFPVTKTWRVLHEFFNRAPNKRQGKRHTVGRKMQGDFRAPPAHLDEATATTVPGERIFVDSRKSWGPYLPSVEDFLDCNRRVSISTCLGITEIQPADSFVARLKQKAQLTKRYRELAAMRQACLGANETAEMTRYVNEMRAMGFTVEFKAHDFAAPSTRFDESISRLFAPSVRAAAVVPLFPALASSGGGLRDFISDNQHYVFSLKENSQLSLSVFVGLVFVFFFSRNFFARRRIAKARAEIPLCIGGWGTRGKSGTERLKAGLFGGLGLDVFGKTTGCEAMFIHAAGGMKAEEVFLYRPYDKATIWEQRNTLETAAKLEADVYLWECMALNPRYVGILQHDWMRDELVTLTNAYPDHEDIQGPAGIDVAETISGFIPFGGKAITSEINFLPLFRDVAKQRSTELDSVNDTQASVFAPETLALFPYQEHPRNIALVARMAHHLGIPEDLAVYAMATTVVADLGVLKVYPWVTAKGRHVQFINCCSANERTGLMNSWQRMGLDAVSIQDEPERMVVGIINNRADRISRSEVFARIMVRDVSVDRFVLIGTNIEGLRGYIADALDDYLGESSVAREDDKGTGPALRRIASGMARLRVCPPDPQLLAQRLEVYATGAGFEVSAPEKTLTLLKELLETLDSLDPKSCHERLRARSDDFKACFEKSLAIESETPLDRIETVETPSFEEALEGFLFEFSKACVWNALNRQCESASPTATNEKFVESYKLIFWANVFSVDNPFVKGDAVVDACLKSVPPGVSASLVGMQNIKGTGLDFVYRWISLDRVVYLLNRLRKSPEDSTEVKELLVQHNDYGALDSGLATRVLAGLEKSEGAVATIDVGLSPEASQLLAINQAALTKMKAVGGQQKGKTATVISKLESWLDPFHSVYRYHKSTKVLDDYAKSRVSLGEAQRTMRHMVALQKGGWLKLKK